jgi:hypothetical protein
VRRPTISKCPNNSLFSLSHSVIARKRAQRTPLGLQRNGAHAPPPEPISELVQPRQRRANVAAGAGPEYLGGRRGARPHDRVEVLWAGLFGPEEVLSAEHELCFCGAQVRQGVESVCLCGAVRCGAVRCEGECSREISVTHFRRKRMRGTRTFCHVLKGSHQLLPAGMSPIQAPAPQSYPPPQGGPVRSAGEKKWYGRARWNARDRMSWTLRE